jgi:hypothetical protein
MPLTPAESALATKLRSEGRSYSTIAAALNCSEMKVFHFFKPRPAKPKPPPSKPKLYHGSIPIRRHVDPNTWGRPSPTKSELARMLHEAVIMTIQKLQWHAPKVVVLGIRRPPRQRVFAIIDKSHQNIFTTTPKVEIIPTRDFKNRVGSRERMGELRGRRRTKEFKRGDPLKYLEFRLVPLPRWVIKKIEADLKIEQAKPIDSKKWQRGIDRLIASIVVKSVIRK